MTEQAKLAQRWTGDGKSVVLGAADTFRAAAIEQLQMWAERVGVEIVKHKAGSDPGAVAHWALTTESDVGNSRRRISRLALNGLVKFALH